MERQSGKEKTRKNEQKDKESEIIEEYNVRIKNADSKFHLTLTENFFLLFE